MHNIGWGCAHQAVMKSMVYLPLTARTLEYWRASPSTPNDFTQKHDEGLADIVLPFGVVQFLNENGIRLKCFADTKVQIYFQTSGMVSEP